MKKAEVVTIPAEMGVPAVEIRGRSGAKTAKPAGKTAKKGEERERTGLKTAERMKETLKKPIKVARTVPIGDDWPEKTTNDAGVREKSAAEGKNGAEVRKSRRKDAGSATGTSRPKKAAGTGTTHTRTGSAKRAKAKQPNEKLTPASIYRKMISFGKTYQVDTEQDFIEAARIYAEEAYLIDQMRDQIAEEGLTVMKTYKTGDVPVAHPLLSELPRHVESANKCLATIGNMIGERGARVEKAARDLDAFRLHAR